LKKKRRINFLKKSERKRKLRKKLKPSNKNYSLDSKRWKRRWW
jgi:hypothetical protein